MSEKRIGQMPRAREETPGGRWAEERYDSFG